MDTAISAIGVTEEPQLDLLFSEPYFRNYLVLIIRANGPVVGVVTSIQDLENRRIAYPESSTAEAWVETDLITKMAIQPEERLLTGGSNEAIQLLTDDLVDVALVDLPVAEFYAEEGNIAIVEYITTNQMYAIAVPPGESALKAVIDSALRRVVDNGTYDSLYDRWIGKPASRPVNPTVKARSENNGTFSQRPCRSYAIEITVESASEFLSYEISEVWLFYNDDAFLLSEHSSVSLNATLTVKATAKIEVDSCRGVRLLDVGVCIDFQAEIHLRTDYRSDSVVGRLHHSEPIAGFSICG